jgi:tripartite-type tricarboxylate transporter receptor subunit TctC
MRALNPLFVALIVSLVHLAWYQGSAQAQPAYPTKTVRFIAPFSAGGSTDILARLVAQHMNNTWGQSVIVENRPGAGGNIGAEVVARAAPDGHVLLLSASSVAINPSLYSKMPFDTVKDLAPIGLVGTIPNILVVHPSLPVHSVKELIALAKKNPGMLTYATGGSGTGSHLIAELFQHRTTTRLTHIPYKGSGPGTIALLSGEVALAFNNLLAAMPHVKSGKMRAVAVTSAARDQSLPDVPTVAESGVPGVSDFEADSWYGVFTTGGTPTAVVEMLNRVLVKIISSAEAKGQLQKLGVAPRTPTVKEFERFMATEMKKWAEVVKISKARVD